MSRRMLFLLAAVLVGVLVPAVLTAQANSKTTPFTLKSDKTTVIWPSSMVCEQNIVFTSPRYDTRLTCGRLKANAAVQSKIDWIEATDAVKVTMTLPGEDKTKPGSHVEGYGELVRCSLKEDTPIIRLLKEKGVTPKLIITDLETKEPTTITGEEIEFNMKTMQITIKKMQMRHAEGEGQ
ncbi:MAG: hypothetical protein ACYDCO_17180 [Armatimonadota bacterium]